MLFTPDPKWDWLKILFVTILAFLGGSLGYTMRTLDANEKLVWWRVFLEGLSAVFFAVITGMICMERGISFGWASALIGASSWIGSRATFILIRAVAFKKLGIDPEKRNESNTTRD
jgi:hypothetical protein